MTAFFSSPFRAAGRVYSSPSCSCSYLSLAPSKSSNQSHQLLISNLPGDLPTPSPSTQFVQLPGVQGSGKKKALWWFLRANLAAIRSDLVRIRVLAGSKWVLRADSFAGVVERWDLGADSVGFALQDLGFRWWWW